MTKRIVQSIAAILASSCSLTFSGFSAELANDAPVVIGSRVEMFGDGLDAVVNWKSGADLSSLIGKPVRILGLLR